MLTPGILLHHRYLIGKQLGQGGMGAVYEATDTKLDCLVAVKEAFTAIDESGRRAFEHEAELLANLDHPALPRVTDYFDQDGALFLVMQYVAGEDLHAMMLRQRKPCQVAEVMRWAEQLLDALDYLHTQTPPVIHRDIKPANIKLTSRNRVMLLDFGLAKGSAGLMTHQSRSVFGGTPVFAPPEQVEGRGTGPRSDLFSLAATLWCLLTFKLPPAVTIRLLELHRQRPDPLAMSNVINPEVSPALAEVLHRAMSLDEEERPASAEAIRDALLGGAATIVEAPRKPQPQLDAETIIEIKPAAKPEQASPPPSEEIVPKAKSEPAPAPPRIEVSEPTVERTAAMLASSAEPEGRRKFLVLGGALALVVLLAGMIGVWLRRGSAPASMKNSPSVTTATVSRPRTFQNRYGIEMVLIPPGSFMMGSTNSYENPVHRVDINYSFYMGRTEVTQAQWQAVMGNNPSRFKGDNLPVESVSWNDAQAFIEKLNQLGDRYVYRLPSEAEWEYACQAGTTGDYAGDLNSTAWYDKNSGSTTHAVGTKQANAFGLYDMCGNVSEWCEDVWHGDYNGAPTDGSAWLSGGDSSDRVLRGGSWIDSAVFLHSASRFRLTPVNRLSLFGFRLVAVVRT